MKFRKEVGCPYCGTRQLVLVDSEETGAVVYCDIEEGGCDRRFVVLSKIKLDVVALGIEGGGQIEPR